MDKTKLNSYLSDGEDIKLFWNTIEIIETNNEDEKQGRSYNSEWIFGATDRRLVYLKDEDNFSDIDYSNIENISQEDNQNSRSPLQKLLFSYGSILAVLGLYVIFESNIVFGLIGALIGIISIVIGIIMELGIIYPLIDYFNSKIGISIYIKPFRPSNKFTIKFSDSCTSKQELEITTEKDVSSELNNIIQNN